MLMNDSEASSNNEYSSPLEGVAIESIQITLDLYRSGKAGVPLNTLWQFACPILDHYQLDLDVDFDTEVTPANVDDMTLLLDVLETASMIWDYCALDKKEKSISFDVLMQNLLGHGPDQHEMNQFIHLLGKMESLWETLSANPTTAAFDGMPCSDDEDSNARSPDRRNGSSYYGPEKLDIPDAFALFSRPLLENDHIHEDPDLLDEAMMRAQAYWDLAHAPGDQIEQHIDVLISQMGKTSEAHHHIKEEALHMIQRFQTLFPERA